MSASKPGSHHASVSTRKTADSVVVVNKTNNHPADESQSKRARPALTLRLVISLLTAFIVLVVAAATFSITYTQGLASSEALGERLTTTLATAAMIRVEERFNAAPTVMSAVYDQMRREGVMLPSDSADPFAVLTRMRDVLLSAFLAVKDVALMIILLDDGSAVAFRRLSANSTHGEVLWTYRGSAKNANRTLGCCHEAMTDEIDLATMRAYPTGLTRDGNLTNRSPGFLAAKSLLAASPRGLWQNAVYLDQVSPPVNALPTARSLRNQSDVFLGLTIFTITIGEVRSFLTELRGTESTKFAALDRLGSVIATTAPETAADAPAVTTTTTLLEATNPPLGCASTFNSAPQDATAWQVQCRRLTRDHSYAPLRAIAGDAELTRPAAGSVVLGRIDGFFVAAAGIRNDHSAFPLSVVAFVPEEDVLGEVYAARNIALAVVCVIFVLACALSFTVIALVLRPLQTVSRNMTRTARLKDVSERDEEGRSALREVYDLQSAYSGMNTAMKSFTRYVPRDVVKDLMASGQLCEIAMKPMNCTMLFVDIAGFTSICERVPPDELSTLVSQYFGTMSGILMRHGGVIDKFVGDCIMGIWGAPFPVGNQEARATLCAFLMDLESRGTELGGAFDAAGELLAIRCGVASGSVLAGNMGSAERMNYTVIGDDVNLAARLEALNKQFGTRVMISERTAHALPAGLFALRLLHRIQVVGKEQPVAVYEVLGLHDGALNTSILTRLKDGEQDEDHSLSFSGSVSLDMSTAESPASDDAAYDDTGRKEAQPMARLLEAAYRRDQGSSAATVATAGTLARARRHETALGHFAARRFADCIDTLRANDFVASVRSDHAADSKSTPSAGEDELPLDRAGEVLLQQAEYHLRQPGDGGGGDFRPVWIATEK